MSVQAQKRDLTFWIGGSLVYFGVVGIGFFALGLAATAVRWQPGPLSAFQIYAPLLLCGMAALVLAAAFRVVLRDSGLTPEQAKRLWSRGCAFGFTMWWSFYMPLMPVRFPRDISGDSSFALTCVASVVAGVILMHYSKPEHGGDQQHDSRPADSAVG